MVFTQGQGLGLILEGVRMSTATVASPVMDMLAAIKTLAPGQVKVFRPVSWEDYEDLLNELKHGYHVRTAYTKGTLEIMAPPYRHERDKETLTAMVRILAKAYGLRAQAAGSTTFSSKQLSLGAEPDSCFYLQNAVRVIGKDTIDLSKDPPPDLVIELDETSDSRGKIDTYAQFGVPEFWRYDGGKIEIHVLSGNQYRPSSQSLAFPAMQAVELATFLEQSKTEGQDVALEALEKLVKQQHNSATDN
jgi:Uma2 family endonuclease